MDQNLCSLYKYNHTNNCVKNRDNVDICKLTYRLNRNIVYKNNAAFCLRMRKCAGKSAKSTKLNFIYIVSFVFIFDGLYN